MHKVDAPEVASSIITGSRDFVINLLEIGPVQEGDIVDVQCGPDIRRL